MMLSDDTDLIGCLEDALAIRGCAVISKEMAALVASVETRLAIGASVPLCELEAILYAAHCGPYGTFYPARMLA